jgi:DNA repair protein RadC
MSAQRRMRLEAVLGAIATLPDFTPEEAKQRCTNVTPQFVTQTLLQLVREGMLQRYDQDKQIRYRWSAAPESFQRDHWIDRQIHAEQVTQTPAEERPRERLLRDGAEALSTADLIAILIRVGVRGESAVTAGRKVANRFADSLPRLRSSSRMELKAVSPAVTQVSYSQIMAGIELGRRVAKAENPQGRTSVRITSSAAATAYCADCFADLAHDGVQEEFHIVTLDTKHKPIATHRITVGTLDASLVHPREVFRAAIRDAAAAVLLVHNHPSGDPTPSREDRQVTDRLTEAGKLIGIQVLDHIIVARESCLSLRDST